MISKQFAWATHLISGVYVKSTFAFQGSACSCSWRHAWWDRCSWTSETVPLLRLQLPGCSNFLYPNRAEVLCCISFLWESSQGLWMWSFVLFLKIVKPSSITVISTLWHCFMFYILSFKNYSNISPHFQGQLLLDNLVDCTKTYEFEVELSVSH